VSLLALSALVSSSACVDVGDPWYAEKPLTVVPDGPISFQEHVQPILRAHDCDVCHSGERPRAGVDVSTADSFFDSSVISACDPDNSVVILQVEACLMPPSDAPGGPVCLDEAELTILRQWIAEGAEAVYHPDTCP